MTDDFSPCRTRSLRATESKRTRRRVSETRLTAAFVGLGVVAWYGSRFVTESSFVQFGLLVGVGVVLPTLLTEWRD